MGIVVLFDIGGSMIVSDMKFSVKGVFKGVIFIVIGVVIVYVIIKLWEGNNWWFW